MTLPCFPLIAAYARHYAALIPKVDTLMLGGVRMAYAGLDNAVDAPARALLAADVAPGYRVATLQARSIAYFVAYLAATSVGAIRMIFDPNQSRSFAQVDGSRLQRNDWTHGIAIIDGVVAPPSPDLWG